MRTSLCLRLGAGLPVAFAVAAAGCASPCGNHMLLEAKSPDGRTRAVLFARDCGATTGVSSQVSVLPLGQREVSGSGNVFVADTDHDQAPSGRGGGPPVALRWLDARTLEIRYHSRARIFQREQRRGDVAVRYIADSTLKMP